MMQCNAMLMLMLVSLLESYAFLGFLGDSLAGKKRVCRISGWFFLMGPRGRGPCWRWELEDADSCRFPGAREEQVMHV